MWHLGSNELPSIFSTSWWLCFAYFFIYKSYLLLINNNKSLTELIANDNLVELIMVSHIVAELQNLL